jgi:hypothetical protein
MVVTRDHVLGTQPHVQQHLWSGLACNKPGVFQRHVVPVGVAHQEQRQESQQQKRSGTQRLLVTQSVNGVRLCDGILHDRRFYLTGKLAAA